MLHRLRSLARTPLPADSGPTVETQMSIRRAIDPGASFVPLPPPSGSAPYRRVLSDVIGAEHAARIDAAGELRFHCVGDTGGWHDPGPHRHVIGEMSSELTGPRPVRFFYHLGDVVYPHGEAAHYRPQFFTPYAGYTAPIFAIPGNHDAEAAPGSRAESLDPFVQTFCAASMPLHDASAGPPRPIVHQPHVYWTLVHDWLWIIGLYTNVPEGGQLDGDQLRWLTGELSAAPADVTVILAMHQPVYSAAIIHGSNLELGDALERCYAQAGRAPDAVIAGHCHNYQRFSRAFDGRAIPYVVAGSGGFWERHRLARGIGRLPRTFAAAPGVTLVACQDEHHGFLTITVGPGVAQATYTAVMTEGSEPVDTFSFGPAAR